MKRLIYLILSLSILSTMTYCTCSMIKCIQFRQNCSGYLKQAADANTVELAKERLSIAVNYLESEKGLTEGFTSIIYATPDEDIGFWHTNLRQALDGLNNISASATLLERSNILMKLNETLLDIGSRTRVTFPAGIELFPYNTVYAIWIIFSLLPFLFICVMAIICESKNM